MRLNTWQNRCSVENSFPLPYEVFELGLARGALLVYVYLVYHKSLRHSANDLSCASIGKAVGLCEKTVRQHLRTLEGQGLIRLAVSRGRLSYKLCPLRDKVRERRHADLLPVPERGWSA